MFTEFMQIRTMQIRTKGLPVLQRQIIKWHVIVTTIDQLSNGERIESSKSASGKKKKKEKNQQEQQETTRNISFVDKVGPLALSMGKHTTGYLLI